MAFSDTAANNQAISILRKSIGHGRLAHAYLLTGDQIGVLEEAARNLAKTLNCEAQLGDDCCDTCATCRKISENNHADVNWLRPESKLRIISIGQVRELMKTINLKPSESSWKCFIISEADRLHVQSANAFLQTLEEPPSQSVIILLSTQPDQLLDTIKSRCLRLTFSGGLRPTLDSAQDQAVDLMLQAVGQGGALFSKYALLSRVSEILQQEKAAIESKLSKQSPLEKYLDAESSQKKKWEDELNAAMEAQYRRRRGEILLGLQWWFRDQWMLSFNQPEEILLLSKSRNQGSKDLSLTAAQCENNLEVLDRTQRLLQTNVQESLALEVCFLELDLG